MEAGLDMPSCEKCWAEAFDPYGSQADNYKKLLEERKDHPCSKKEQAGQYWDDEKQIDSRLESEG